jgi:serine/threonine-protein kinase
MGAPVRVGDVLAEKYEVTRILGQGGMGVVVAARHRELDKLVALKFMHEEVAQNEQAIDRFLREARAAARLQNEHVGRVLDVGRMQGGIPYIVMEYLEGRDLSEVQAERGQMDVADVCEYVLQACEAMAEAHAQGIIHRDLKPQNLFLTTRQDGRPLVKVLDFGISKATFANAATATHATMGSPAYMSPEQMKSAKSVDPRADIWSLGIILYQLLSNTLPFYGETITETMLKVLSDPLPSLASVRPGLPPALVAAIEKCLQKDRDQRFDNVAELAHELTPFAPERARAAMSLIERVMSSAGASQPARRFEDDDVVPSVSTAAPGVAPTVPPTAAPQPYKNVQTTLGTAAAQSLDIAPRARSGGGKKWMLALFAVGIVGAVGITIAVMSSGGGAKSAAAPQPDAAIASPELDAGTVRTPEPEVKKPEPEVKLEPEVKKPDPVVKKPDPVVKKPDPVVKKPDPVVKKPDPVVKKPDPVKPEPVSKPDAGSGSAKPEDKKPTGPDIPRDDRKVNIPR